MVPSFLCVGSQGQLKGDHQFVVFESYDSQLACFSSSFLATPNGEALLLGRWSPKKAEVGVDGGQALAAFTELHVKSFGDKC